MDLLENLTTELIAWERSKSAQNQYPLVIKRYLACTEPEDVFTRAGVNKYLVKLDKEGKRGNTKRFNFYILKKFFEVNDQKWPFSRGAPPKTPKDELNNPAMPSEDIKTIIRNRGRLEDWQAGVMALSTTYGLRQEEILQVRSGDISDGSIFIHTVKHGEEGWHILPQEITPYVEAWASLGDSRRPAKSTLFVEFHRICQLCGVTTGRGVNFHSIRRTLATELSRSGKVGMELVARGAATPEMVGSGLNLMAVYQFLRWSLPSAFGMLGVYSHMDDELVDQAILSLNVHPFLKYWGEE